MGSARPTLLAFLVVGLTGTSCLTHALWSSLDEPRTYVHTVSVPCKVLDVRRVTTTASGAVATPGIAVQYEAEPRAGAPGHILRSASAPGWLMLQGAEDWRHLAGAERFVPEEWDLRVTNGNYFRRPTANARVAYRGTARRAAIGSVVDAADLAPDLLSPARSLPPPDSDIGDEARCLEAFDTHDWLHLLSDDPHDYGHSARPVAWLDPDGEVLDEAPVAGTTADSLFRPSRPDMARCSLIGRIEDVFGEVTFVRVPVPVLLQGADLVLMRAGDAVVWRRSLVCPAELVSPGSDPVALASAPRFDLPMHRRRFDYRWGREMQESQTIPYAWRTALTPITAVLDALIWTNQYLRRLAEFITGEDFDPDPQGPPRR